MSKFDEKQNDLLSKLSSQSDAVAEMVAQRNFFKNKAESLKVFFL